MRSLLRPGAAELEPLASEPGSLGDKLNNLRLLGCLEPHSAQSCGDRTAEAADVSKTLCSLMATNSVLGFRA